MHITFNVKTHVRTYVHLEPRRPAEHVGARGAQLGGVVVALNASPLSGSSRVTCSAEACGSPRGGGVRGAERTLGAVPFWMSGATKVPFRTLGAEVLFWRLGATVRSPLPSHFYQYYIILGLFLFNSHTILIILMFFLVYSSIIFWCYSSVIAKLFDILVTFFL